MISNIFPLQKYNYFLKYARKMCEFEPKLVVFVQLWLKLIYEFEPKVVNFIQLWLKLVIFYGNPICQRTHLGCQHSAVSFEILRLFYEL